ncbi:SRPBCC domain-containing protein [Alteromonas sp. C1M14]|uniref:SRPBCC family protein n=1 Tax=Alteromonas sp. C1M14 TaxID=2841567 RepID=UPI001C08D0CD|nr:SRPBCC domain-containing protein [Alteromonas sp. C1M14]MBU2979500.1 SRPBCC domain-containing protein [Alteromonas sp. C1M14]
MPDLHLSADLPLTPSRAYEAFSHTELLSVWLVASPQALLSLSIDFIEGGTFRFQLLNIEEQCITCKGEFARLRPKEQISFSMHISGLSDDVGETSVDIRLFPQAQGVHIVVHHEGINSSKMADKLTVYWEQAISRLGLLV